MAEPFVSLLLEKLSYLIEREVGVVFGVKKELKKLQEELNIIRDVLQDADLMQFSSEHVKFWLEQLKSAAYDAEDIVDEYGSRLGTTGRRSRETSKCQTCFISTFKLKHVGFLCKVGSRIKEISMRLNEISSNKDKYGLASIARESNLHHVTESYRQTSSVMVESEIVGREEDAQVMIEWLLEKMDVKEEKNASVFSIVGTGGLGKTTLAKKVYNNNRVREHFDKSMWVYVSEKPRPTELAKKILDDVNRGETSIGGGSSNIVTGITGLNTLYAGIIDSLTNKRFLLVLDDVWDADWWAELKSPLQSGAQGSKILVTSRNKHLSVEMGATYIHELKGLSNDQSWLLFLKKALKDEETEQDLEVLMLKGIGEEIVKKCGGLPLAVKTMGSAMRFRTRFRADWQAVMNSKIWDYCRQSSADQSILPALLLSYNHLPMHLKRCFMFCSIFPKDFWIYQNYLTRLWMAEGFIPDEGVEMEITANEYIEDMVGRCLFQDEKRDEDGRIVKFKMHAVVHDLALYVAGKEYSQTINSNATRHLSLIGKKDQSFGEERKSFLRTLLLPNKDEVGYVIYKVLGNFKRLRVLDLSDNVTLSKLPDSIGDLILLRYLNLSNTKLKELPESIGNLCNLQTLQLGKYIKELPKSISSLLELRNLEFESSLNMPQGTKNLTCLRFLSKFVVGCRDKKGCSIAELKNLNKLRGNLVIENLERVRSREEARQAQLSKKEHLESLELWWEERDDNSDVSREDSERMEEVFEELEPPPNIIRVEICDYLGKKFPAWSLMSMRALREVLLYSCKMVEHLPSLGKLPLLKRLYVFQAYKVRNLNDDFHGIDDGRNIGFAGLEELSLLQMNAWEDWSCKDDAVVMPCLRSLYLTDCPKLKSLSISFQALETLTVYRCVDLHILSNMPALTKLDIRGCESLQTLPCLPALVSLYIESSPNWEGWVETTNETSVPVLQIFYLRYCPKLRKLPYLPMLTTLYIKDCDGLHSLWEVERQPMKLEFLEIGDCPKLRNFRCISSTLMEPPPTQDSIILDELVHLTHLKIKNLPELRSIPETLLNLTSLEIDGVPKFPSLMEMQELGRKLKRVTIRNCSKLNSMPEQLQHLIELQFLSIGNLYEMSYLPEWLQNLTALKSLIIKDCPILECLSEEMQNLTELQVLEIDGLPELDSLPNWLPNLSKLIELKIKNCPQLRYIPETFVQLQALKFMLIRGCPLLEERCKREVGEDWHKISHIQTLSI